jgi:uncharacterized protein
MTHSCFYEGWLLHRRYTPRRHDFRYRVFMSYLDLAELPELLDQRLLWSARRANMAWFRRGDYLGDSTESLDDAVRYLVEARTGWRPQGPIRLLTNLRHFGVRMNPLSLFYCFDSSDQRVVAVVAEVTNTPWNERHHYVLDLRDQQPARRFESRHDKELHVSPFFTMDLEYRWRLSEPGERLAVQISAEKSAQRSFSGALCLRRKPFDARQAARLMLRYPCMPAQVFCGIYLQAWRLWRKGIPFVPHPQRAARSTPRAIGESSVLAGALGSKTK